MIEKIYDNFLLKENQKEKETRKEQISLSQVGKCTRYLLMLGKPEYPSAELDKYTLRTFRHGKIIENDIMTALKAEGKLIAEQVKVVYRGITGTLDWIVYNDAMKCNMLVDCKTAKESSFQYMDKANQEISEDYKYQLCAYYHAGIMQPKVELLRDKYELNKNALVSYVSKDNSLFYEPKLDCEAYLPTLDKKIDEIEYWQKQSTLPPEKTVWQKRVKGVLTNVDTPLYPCYNIQKDSRTRKPIAVKAWCGKIKSCPRIYCQYLQDCKKLGQKIDEQTLPVHTMNREEVKNYYQTDDIHTIRLGVELPNYRQARYYSEGTLDKGE